MDVDKIKELIDVLESSSTQELLVRKGDLSVHIRKGVKPEAPVVKKPSVEAGPEPAKPAEPSDERYILAPMVGIFRTIDGIAVVDSRVKVGQVVGAIESMKLLNDVVSDVSGVVVETMVEDGMPVEYGQHLCRVKKDRPEAVA
jgi:acetyl-CoA carboxylase biotin carboxyl carrier protein